MEKVVIGIDVETATSIANLKNFSNELGQLATQISKEEKELARLKKEFKESTNPSQELAASFAEQTAKLKLLKNAYNQAEKGATGLKGFTDKLRTGITDGATSVLGYAGAAGIAAAAVTKLADAFIQTNKEVTDLQRQAEFLFDKPAEDARAFATDVAILGKSFNLDLNETMKTANVLSKEFGISAEEALEKLRSGLEAGGRFSGDFLGQLGEFSTQLSAVGLSADESIAILTQTIDQGIFSSKGLDSIKEAGLKLRELPQATQDALKGIGLGELPKLIQDGTVTTFEAIQQISGKLGELPPQSQAVGTAIADVFGGAGEDAGKFIFELANINTNLAELPSTLTAGEKASNRLTEAWTNLLTTDGDTSSFFSGIVNGLAAILEAGDEAFSAIGDVFSELFSAFGEIGAAFGLFNEEGESTFSLVNLLKGAIETATIPFELLGKAVTIGARLFVFFVDNIKAAYNDLIGFLPDSLAEALGLEKFNVDLEASAKGVQDAFGGLVDYAITKPGEIAGAFSGATDKLKEEAKKAADEIKNSTSSKATDAAKTIVEQFKKAGSNSTIDIAKLSSDQAKVIADSFAGVGGADAAKVAEVQKEIAAKVAEGVKVLSEEEEAAASKRKAAGEAAAKQAEADRKAIEGFIEALKRKNEAGQVALQNEADIAAKTSEFRKQGLDESTIAIAVEQEKIVQTLDAKKAAIEQEFQDKIKGKTIEKDALIALERAKNDSILQLEQEAQSNIIESSQKVIDSITKYAEALGVKVEKDREAGAASAELNQAEQEGQIRVMEAKKKALEEGATIAEANKIAEQAAFDESIKLKELAAAKELEITTKKLDEDLAAKTKAAEDAKALIDQQIADGTVTPEDGGEAKAALDEAAAEATAATNDAKLQAEAEFQTTLTGIKVEGDQRRAEADIQAKEDEIARLEQTKAIASGLALQMGNAIGEGLGASEKGAKEANKKIALAALDGLKSLIPIFIAEIMGKSLSQLGPVAGAVAGGLATGVLYGLVGVAKNSISKKAQGGEVRGPGGPTQDNLPHMLSNGEFVVRASVAQKNLGFLKSLNAGEMTPMSPQATAMQEEVDQTYSIAANKEASGGINVSISESEITGAQKRVKKYESGSLLS